ncbi:hypothetical protein PAXINDRAFT_6199 [Paxillus involutus ATCC 200175]|nr:hypothetical protein PAXINDRAFT_6199 [Paxillus involutus ATCC 200175]
MRRETLPIGDDDEPGPEGGAASGAATDASIDHSDDEDEDANDEEDDIHGYGKKRRDEEFTRLAEQFAERKEAIGGIMNKVLDDLSTVLKAFHALPMPTLDLAASASRANTMSSTASNTSKASSSPAQGLYFGQTSSPRSPFSPSNVGTSFPPRGAAFPADTSFATPGPPPPTLAPPVSSAAGPRILGPITTAAPPRGTSPKIIAEAQHVESPIDIHHIQSAFRGAMVG